MSVKSGSLRCEKQLKIVSIDRWRKTVTVEYEDGTRTMFRPGDTLMFEYRLDLNAEPGTPALRQF